jgi:phosphinothricin acetyltransferase
MSSQSSSIRGATAQDAERIAEIYNHYVLNSTITFEEVPVAAAEMARRIAALPAELLPWLVAAGTNQISGFAYAQKWKSRAAYRYSAEVTVYVAPGLGNSGIGSQLYSALFAALKSLGFHAVIGGVALPNDASLRLHRRFGFEKVAHFKQVGFKFDRWIDVTYWQLIL